MTPILIRKPSEKLEAEGFFAQACIGLAAVFRPRGIGIDPETLWEQTIPDE